MPRVSPTETWRSRGCETATMEGWHVKHRQEAVTVHTYYVDLPPGQISEEEHDDRNEGPRCGASVDRGLYIREHSAGGWLLPRSRPSLLLRARLEEWGMMNSSSSTEGGQLGGVRWSRISSIFPPCMSANVSCLVSINGHSGAASWTLFERAQLRAGEGP